MDRHIKFLEKKFRDVFVFVAIVVVLGSLKCSRKRFASLLLSLSSEKQ